MPVLSAVFMGTPDFAVPGLRALVEAGIDVRAVVTQPDRKRGRGQDVAEGRYRCEPIRADPTERPVGEEDP